MHHARGGGLIDVELRRGMSSWYKWIRLANILKLCAVCVGFVFYLGFFRFSYRILREFQRDIVEREPIMHILLLATNNAALLLFSKKHVSTQIFIQLKHSDEYTNFLLLCSMQKKKTKYIHSPHANKNNQTLIIHALFIRIHLPT